MNWLNVWLFVRIPLYLMICPSVSIITPAAIPTVPVTGSPGGSWNCVLGGVDKMYIRTIFYLLLFFAFSSAVFARGGDVPVHGYTRADGAYVQPHMRSAPDGTTSNNWSTYGNYNPYTGKEGTRHYSQQDVPNAYPSPYAVPAPQPTFEDQMQSWMGHSAYELKCKLGDSYKTHKQKHGTSIEYADNNERLEFFLDTNGVIFAWKTWSYL